jgi:hypothetical protein
MQKPFSLGPILLEIIELSFIVFLPIPIWLKLIIFFILGFVGYILPFIILPFVVAGWVWAYIYVWQNDQHIGLTVFFMIMLLLFGLDILLTKTVYQHMSPLQRPPIVTTKRFSIEMWAIAVCAILADIAMLIHLIAF